MPSEENDQAPTSDIIEQQGHHDAVRACDDASPEHSRVSPAQPHDKSPLPTGTPEPDPPGTGRDDRYTRLPTDLNNLTPQQQSACIAFLTTAAEASAPSTPRGDSGRDNEAAGTVSAGIMELATTERGAADVPMDAAEGGEEEEVADHSSPPEFDMSEFAESNLQAIAAAQIAAGLGDLDFGGVADPEEASTSASVAAHPQGASDDPSPKRGIKRRRSSAAGHPAQVAASGSPASSPSPALNEARPRTSIGSAGNTASSHASPFQSTSAKSASPSQATSSQHAQPAPARPTLPSAGSARPQLPSAAAGQRPPPPPPTTSTNRPPPNGPRPGQGRAPGSALARPPQGPRPPPGARPPGPALPASALFSAAPPGAPSFAALLSTLGPQDLAMVAQAAMGLDANGNPLPGNEESHRALADAMRRLRESATARPAQAPPSRPPPPRPSPSAKPPAPKTKQPPKTPKARQPSADLGHNASSPARSASASIPPDNGGDIVDALPRTGDPLEDKKPLIAGPTPDRAPPKPGPPPEKRFQCPKCDRAFARAYNLNTHLSTHDPDPNRSKPFPCPYPSCRTENRSFSRKHDLQRHIASTHESEPEPILEVVQGDDGEVVQSNLAKLGLGAPGRKFRCQCGRAFVRRDALRRHQCDATKGSADFEGSDSNMSPSGNSRSRSKNARSNVDYESEDELDLTDFDAIAASFTAAAEEELRAAAEQDSHPGPESKDARDGEGVGDDDEQGQDQQGERHDEEEEEEEEADELDLTDFDAIAASFTTAAEEGILAEQDPQDEAGQEGQEANASEPIDAPAADLGRTGPASVAKEGGAEVADGPGAPVVAAVPEVKVEQEQS